MLVTTMRVLLSGVVNESSVLKGEVCMEYPVLEPQLGSCGGEVWGIISNAR